MEMQHRRKYMKTKRNIILTISVAMALAWSMAQGLAQLVLSPNVDYSFPNYAYSGPIRKFVDTLPGLTAGGANGVGQYIPVAVANTPYLVSGVPPYGTTSDYYEIGLVEYIERMHTDLPSTGTKLRGYVQIVPSGYAGAVALNKANGCSMNVTNGSGVQMYGADKPHYLGPLILSTMNRAVRIKFMNLLPTGTNGNLFVPVDNSSIMGSAEGWKQIGTDGNGLPIYEKYTQNRATIHLHGGLPPWISDGTAHQWTVPAGEVTSYKKGASAAMVPDMENGTNQNGVITFYWPNQMSGRLMFYHDHAWGMTSATVYSGQAGAYLVLDPIEEAALKNGGIPGTIVTSPTTGGIVSADLAHLIPLVIQDKTFVPPVGVSPTNATATATTDGSGGIATIVPVNAGSGYPVAPAVSITDTAPGTGAGAAGTAILGANGSIASITVTSPGSGYTAPVVTIDASRGTGLRGMDPNWLTDVKDGMTGVAPIEGNLWFPHIYIPNQWPGNPDGSGSNPLGRWDWGPWFWPVWPLAPGVVPPTVSHAPEAFVDTIMVNGQPYPYLNVSNTVYRLRILNACNDRMLNLQLYKATPGIITNIVISGGVAAITVDNAGSGYDPLSPPIVTIACAAGDTTGSGATATAIVNNSGAVTDITVTSAGSAYTLDPIVTLAPPVSGITATATAIRNYGYDPLAPPYVTITGGGGRGAMATAVVSDLGVVTAVNVDSVGSGYSTVPTVVIDPPAFVGGVQATATAQIYTRPTEVGMVPASPIAGITFPAAWRAQTIPYTPDILDGRVGGIPDPTNRGPAFVQFGTEGGFLPAPVTLLNTPVGYEQNKKNIVVLNVKEKTLYLAPAERADVIVDFTAFAGKTVILYNDSGAPVPAADGRNDFYTGNPDYTPAGGAPSTLAGMGPSTRTIMVFNVAGSGGAATPDSVPAAMVTTLNSILPTLFKSEQPAPVVPEAAYNGMYTGGGTSNTYSRIQDTSLSFVPYGSTTPLLITMQMLPKTIQELFDNVGRLNATLGTELPFTMANIQTTVPLNYVDPTTELFNDGETQIWKITHNGVDTHGVHFHLFDVQLINRVGWDGQITPPDANERGWKDTVRMNPLEDIIVAMRAVKPTSIPFGVPKSYRVLNPAVPTNSLVGFSNLDPLTGNAFVPAISNVWTDFGWEYAWHCHILGHEDNDMMRPIVMNVVDTVPNTPTVLTATLQTTPTLLVNLAWIDNSVNEVGFQIWRKTDTAAFVQIGAVGANSRAFSDPNIATGHTYVYYVVAYNSAGISASSNQATISTVVGQPIPTGLTATPSVLSTATPTVTLRFTDNSTTETGFTIQRSTDATFATGVTTLPTVGPRTPGAGLTVTVVDNNSVLEATTYNYRVRANGLPANSAWSNIATATTPGRLPAAPSNVRSGGATRVQITLRWNDNSNNETGFTVSRGPGATGPWTLVTTTTANTTSTTVTGLIRNTTYFFQVIAINAYGQSPAAVSSGLPTLP